MLESNGMLNIPQRALSVDKNMFGSEELCCLASCKPLKWFKRTSGYGGSSIANGIVSNEMLWATRSRVRTWGQIVEHKMENICTMSFYY